MNIHNLQWAWTYDSVELHSNATVSNWIFAYIQEWQQSKECMCCLRNIDMRDYQESVTSGQTDGHTDGQTDTTPDRVIPMYRYDSQATQ